MAHGNTEHEVLAVVFQVGYLPSESGASKPRLNVLLWERALEPERDRWSLPGGQLRTDEDLTTPPAQPAHAQRARPPPPSTSPISP